MNQQEDRSTVIRESLQKMYEMGKRHGREEVLLEKAIKQLRPNPK